MLSKAVTKISRKFGKDKDFKEIAKGGSLSFGINVAGMCLGYLFVIIISRVYGSSSAAIYGQYVLVTLLLRIASIITRFGTDTAMLQLTAGFAAKKLWFNIENIRRKFLGIIFCLGSLVSLIVILFSQWWASALKLPQNMVMLSGIFILPMAIGLFYSQSLRGLKK